jgi:hypothetical protein
VREAATASGTMHAESNWREELEQGGVANEFELDRNDNKNLKEWKESGIQPKVG